MLKRFLSYYKPHRLIFTLDMIASLLVACIGIVYPIITRSILNGFIEHTATTKFVIILGCSLLGLYLLKMALNYFIQYYGHLMGVKIQAKMRRDMFKHLERLPYSFYDDHESGKIVSRMTSDLFDVVELAHHGPGKSVVAASKKKNLHKSVGSFFTLYQREYSRQSKDCGERVVKHKQDFEKTRWNKQTCNK